MSKYYIYKMEILDNNKYSGIYIGQHKIGKKEPICDGYNGSGSKWREHVLKNHIPVKKTILMLCDNINESNFWERYFIEQAEQSDEFLWNVKKGGDNHESDRIYTEEEIKAHNKERFQRWYKDNKERFIEHQRQYRKANKERLDIKKKQYEEEHKEFYKEYHKRYYQENKETISEQRKQYWIDNRERFRESRKSYFAQYKETHADYLKQKQKEYNQAHKEERKQYYQQLCCYNGEMLTLRALILRLRRRNIENPTETAKQYLIKGGQEYAV